MNEPVRRRRAPRAERTTDVTRFRGVLVAAIAGSIAVVVATIILASGDGSPGPIARPHAINAVACASCHDSPTYAAACTACHGPRKSTRDGHRKLVAKGTLSCVDCHPGHGGGGVTLAIDGTAVRYGTGADEPAGTTRFRPKAPVTVPIVGAATCARCHDLSPKDPASGCLISGQEALGVARPTVCFDEHRVVRDTAGVIAPRSAAWDAAREVATKVPRAPSTPHAPGNPWPWVGIGLLVAGLGWTGARAIDRRARPKPAPANAAPAVTPLKRLPVIDSATCLGCYACVDACPYDVLEIQRYVAFVAKPADCCGLILCEQKCPNGSLAIAFEDAPSTGIALGESFESRAVPGVYLAGDVGGQPLIRNAINQGAQAVRAIAAAIKPHGAELDLVIVGAGPAGLAAALEAKARGLRYVALEQATIADSIRSFPRGKLVIDPDLPNTSALWLAEATKEELLARWTRIVRETRPAIEEGRRVVRIARGEHFTVDDIDRDGVERSRTAARVLIAIGRRGTPRRLAAEIPAEVTDHVHYSLADAHSFAGRRVLVVGLGDVAMEAAVALSRQPGTDVTLVARAPDFQRGKARNIAEVHRRVASGNLRVMWQSQVMSLATGRVTLGTSGGAVEVACDSVFVLIGSIPAEGLLRGLGLLA